MNSRSDVLCVKLKNPDTGESLEVLSPAIFPNVEQVLGQKLRAAFADVLEEPVPRRFLDLLDELTRTSVQ